MAVTRFYPGELPDDRYPIRYKVNDDGTISTLQSPAIGDRNQKRINIENYSNQSGNFPFTNIDDAQNEVARRQRSEIKNSAAPTKKEILSKEKFFYDVYKPSIGGDAGLLSFFPSGGRGAGQVDGSPRVPDYNQFMSGVSTFSHRHDGKVYPLYASIKSGDDLNAKYDAYVASEKERQRIEKETADREAKYTSVSEQIKGYTTTNKLDAQPIYSALSNLSAARNFGASDYATKLNFQVSDQQIIDDLNNARLQRLARISESGNAQIVGIQERINQANQLISQLPQGDARRTSSESAISTLTSDLKSVNEAIAEANNQIKNYKPITANDVAGQKDITSFREFLQLPEERASQQLRQIDPDSYETSLELGRRYREMAAAPIGETKSAQAEQLRSNLEQEAINQLALGSQLGAEEQRQYQQAARAAQTARGNIFGVAPAVEEAVTTGLAGEQRKLARYGAATQFLASGQNTSDALKSDIAFRDALLQNRLGAASGFVAGGPSIYNLSQARTAQQQGAFQNYIQANQALPGGFNQQPSTAANFYQTTSQEIPVALTNAFNQLYNSQSDYGARTYSARVGAIASQPSGAQQFAQIAGGIGSLMPSFSFSR